MNLIDFVNINENKGFLKIKVLPNSPKTEFVGLMDDGTLKMKSKGIPENGKVNLEIIKFLSKELKISKDNIKIISGGTSRIKLIKIDF
ncbi:MAG: DUF167 domain-containing protein [Candidatus Gracilibacteria bacterium]|nr:DUF167 domain-containing protein [Candidatus Gracilibacteria bacterium]